MMSLCGINLPSQGFAVPVAWDCSLLWHSPDFSLEEGRLSCSSVDHFVSEGLSHSPQFCFTAEWDYGNAWALSLSHCLSD